MPIRIVPDIKADDRHPRKAKGEKSRAQEQKRQRQADYMKTGRAQEQKRQRQADYMKKHGPQKPRRKTLGVTDKYKEVREKRKFSEAGFKPLRTSKQLGGRIGLKKGSNKNWIQKAVNPKHKGFCTPMTKKTCTPKRKALARTFKKMGRARKGR